MKATKGVQLRLLLWKNWIIQKRRPISTLAEILVPVLLFLLLWALRGIISVENVPDTVFCSTGISGLDYDRFYNDEAFGSRPTFEDYPCRSSRPSLFSIFGLPQAFRDDDEPEENVYPIIAYAPNTIPEVVEIMDKFSQALTQQFGFDFVGGPHNLTGFSSREALLTAYDELLDTQFGLAVIFHEDNNGNMGSVGFTPNHVHYVMRMPEGLPSNSFEGWGTDRSFPQFVGLGPNIRSTYLEDSRFTTIQTTLDASIIAARNGTFPFVIPRLSPMPWPSYSSDGFIFAIRNTLPFILVISFIYSVTTLVRLLVTEKEKRLKEAMAMMGLSPSINWLAWFIRSFTMLFISIVLMTLIFEGGRFTKYSDTGVVFVFLLLFVISTIAFCFLISTLFSRASSAATAGGLLFFLAFCPNYYVEPNFESISSSDKAGFCVLSPTCVGIGAYILSVFESSGEGLSFGNLEAGSSEKDTFSMAHVFLMLIVDTVIYIFLTWYISNVRPGEYGLAKPFYFFFLPSYWRGESIDEEYHATSINDNPEFFELLLKGTKVGVRINNLSKVFKAETGGMKVAVDGLTLDVAENQITALLGHNGAGKTTTMSILVGLFSPTSGNATINGHDITTNMTAARASLGLCPQFDVLFDALTFEEHIIFFSRLKGLTVDNARREVITYSKDLDLEEKVMDPVSTLSGGQRRAVSVSIALCGDSKVVFLDEPTSGMDPYKRRHTWDLLLKHKQGRTMLLTTHFMEEADLLGDRIAIMAEGKLRTVGSSLFLKSRFGVGYRMNLVKRPNCSPGDIDSLITNHIPNAKLVSNIGTELAFILPHQDVKVFPQLFDDLDQQKKSFGISSYGVSVTTMEEVFLKVAEGNTKTLAEHETAPEVRVLVNDDTLDRNNIDTLPEPLDGLSLYISQCRAMLTKRFLYSSRNKWAILTQLVIPLLFAIAALAIAQAGESETRQPLRSMDFSNYPGTVKVFSSALDIAGDYRSWLNIDAKRQVSNLGQRGSPLQERLYTHLENFLDEASDAERISFMPLSNMSSIILNNSAAQNYQKSGFYNEHIATFALEAGAFYVAYNSQNDSCDILPSGGTVNSNAGLDLVPGQTYTLVSTSEPFFSHTADGANRLNIEDVSRIIQQGGSPAFAITIELTEDVKALLENANNSVYFFCSDGSSASIELRLNATTSTISDAVNAYVHFSPRALHSPAETIAVIGNMMAREYISHDASIHVYNQPLPESASEAVDAILSDATGLNLGIFMTFSSGFLMASFALFVLVERVCKAKHVQFVSGVNIYIFWGSSYLWDWLSMIVPGIGLIIILAAFNIDAYNGQYGLVFGVFMMFTFAAIPFVYCISYLFSTPSGAYATISIVFVLLGLGGLIAVFVTTILDETELANIFRYVFLIIPNYAFGQSLYDIWLNSKFKDLLERFSEICNGEFQNGAIGDLCTSHQPNYASWDEPGVGKAFLYLFLSGVWWFSTLLLLDMGVLHMPRAMANYLGRREDDVDVKREKERIERGNVSDELLVVRGLNKTFRKKRDKHFTAVDKLTFGIPRGECFGMLGVNGAGKTTTFRMLTGEIQPSAGAIAVAGYNLESDIRKARRNMGYCPQFDGLLGLLTAREHLQIYARLRGVPETHVSSVCQQLIQELDLSPHASKPAYTYSGGNKRKLSTASCDSNIRILTLSTSAIALVGQPSLVLLDEPTTGMDPQARRFLWSVLARVTARGQSIVLTSHSMEECEALCHRLAIMVNGHFKCLGSVGHLKNRFGKGYALQARIKLDDPGSTIDTAPLKEFIEQSYMGAVLMEEHSGSVSYRIEHETRSWSYMFSKLLEAAQRFSLEDYNLTQVSLERVFLYFAAEQHEDRDTRNGKKPKRSNQQNSSERHASAVIV